MRGRNAQVAAAAAERRWQAWELYRRGATTRSIGAALGVSHTAVEGYLKRVTKEFERRTYATAKTHKLALLENYREYFLNMGPLLRAGDPSAVRAAVRVGQEIAKLLGLYEPELIDIGPELQKLAREAGLDVETAAGIVRQILDEEP